MGVADYEGIIAQIPLGTMGLLTDLAPGMIPHTALINSRNVDYGPGYIQKAPGSLRYNTTVLPDTQVVGLFDYWPNSVTQRLFAATSAGNIYRDIGDRVFGGGTAVASSLGTLTNQCQFLQAGSETASRGKKLFFFSHGQNQVKVLEGDGTSFASISDPSSDWSSPNFPRFGLTHRSRLWAFMGSQAYASTTGDHEDFTSAGNISMTVGPGDGGDCLAGVIYKGKMLIFKEGDVVYALNDSDTTSSNWYFYRLGEGLGVASIHAGTTVIDDLLIGNSAGSLTSYSAVQNFGDVKSGDILTQAQVSKFFRENTTPSGYRHMHALYYAEKRLAMFTARTLYGINNNALVTLDVSYPGTPRYGLWTKDSPQCLALRKDVNGVRRPIYGGSDGYVYLMDREDRLVGGSAYTGEFKVPHLDMGHLDPNLRSKDKLWDHLMVTFSPEGNHNLSVDVFIDGKFTETLSFVQTIDSNYMGSFALGSSKLGVEEEGKITKPLHGSGKSISFRCYNAGASENFKVAMLTVFFRLAGNNETRLHTG